MKNNLLDIRLRLKFKRAKDFAEFLDMNRDQYYKYENHLAEPGKEVLYKIYKKLKSIDPDIHLEDLLYEDIEQE